MRAKENRMLVESGVARKVTDMVNGSDLSQREIANAIGYPKSNIITMFKQGTTKVPLNKAAKLAKICDADPTSFVRLCIEEYAPGIWDALQEIFTAALDSDEEKVVKSVRKAVKDSGGALAVTPTKLAMLREFVKEHLVKQP